jgi:hypothetical protein
MVSKSKNILSGRFDSKSVVVEITPEVTINTKVKVQSLVDAHVYYTGQISGELYEWVKAGAIVEVDERDVPELLAKRPGKKPCCGGERKNIFELTQ